MGGTVRINDLWFLFFLMYLLTSCGGMRGNLADVRDQPGKEPIVFGRVKLIEGGQPKESFGSSFAVHIIPYAAPEPIPTYVYVLKKDGSFY